MEGNLHFSSSTPKIERKFVEKNRRNQMKTLYSKLGSLLPYQNSKVKGGVAVPDQIDEAVEYIKSLQKKLEKSREKKERLTRRKREHACITSDIMRSTKSPQIEVHEIGPNLQTVLINGLDNPLNFYEIIRVLHEEGAEIAHANFSNSRNSTIHILHEKIGEPAHNFEATATCERPKELIPGPSSSCSEVETQLDVWDFEISNLLFQNC